MSATADGRGLLRGPEALRLLVITGGVALHAVSIYVVATIMPLVVRDVGGLSFFAWTATLYVAGSLCSASSVPLLLSRTSARVVYRLAFGVFLSGSLVCAMAPNMGVLLAGRLLQGIGGGMLPALAYAIIRQIFPSGMHARAIAIVGSVWGVAALLGPSVGGVFAELGAWRWAFGVDVVIGALFILTSENVLPRARDPGTVARPVPGLRIGLLILAAICVSAGGATGRPLPSLLGIAAAIALIVAMLRVDARSGLRMLPKGAFDPRFGIGAVSATMGLLILSSSPGTFVPYMLIAGHGVSPLLAGYINASFALSWTVVSLLTSRANAAGARLAIGVGPAVMLAGLATLAFAIPSGTIWVVFVGLVLMGAGIGMGWPHLGALMMHVVPAADRDVAGPFISTTQTLSAVFGSSIAGMVANLAGLADAHAPSDIAAVAAWLYGVMTVGPLLGCLMAWRGLYLTRNE